MPYVDIEYNARTNPEFRAKIEQYGEAMKYLEGKAMGDPLARARLGQTIKGFMKLCDYNHGFLTGYFFPKYPREKPLTLVDRPYSYSMFNMQIGGFTCIRGSRQTGKEQPYSAKVMTPAGWQLMGSLKVGDLICGRDGNSYPIQEIFEQGISDVYELEFTDRSKAECGWYHNWMVRGNGCSNWQVRTLGDIVTRNVMEPYSDNAVRIPLVEPIILPAVSHIIPPYVLGVLLGDGCLAVANSNVRLSNIDQELLNFVREDMPSICLRARSNNDYDLCSHKLFERTPLKSELRRMGLMHCRSITKFIPQEYLLDSVENRLMLLRGLMDTDGTICGKCQMEYYSISIKLAEAVMWIVQSLGGTAQIKEKEGWYRKKDGTKKICSTCYRVKIKFQDINPFRISRKAKLFYQIRYARTRVLKRVKKVRQEQSRCLLVSSPDHTYVTNDFVVTHNSVSLAARSLINTLMFPGFRSIYLTPHNDQRKTYADKLREMERAFRFLRYSSKYRQNVYHKEYEKGGMLKLVYVLTTAAAVRGNSADELLFDEYQNFDISLEPEVLAIQNASDMPIRIYSGTSLTTDTALEAKYAISSQASWMIRCPCGEWLNPSDRATVLDLIQPEGVVCPKCSRVQDVRLGQFVHADQEMLRNNQVGFHIPQIIVPFFTEDPVRWKELYDKKVGGGDSRKFFQEVLGIPSEEGEREITLQHLKDMCVNDLEASRVKAKSGQYMLIVSGCDWGGSDYIADLRTKKSFTVHAMLGVNHDRTIDIIHFQEYSGMDYRSVADDIVRNHYELNGEALASDFGVGQLYNMLLRERINNVNKHMVFGYVGPSSSALSEPQGEHMFNQFSLNRTEAITSLYDAIKQGRIKCYAWQHSSRFLLDFLNLFRTTSDSATGSTSFTYRRHGSKTDDALHAVNFAYVLARVILGEPLINDKALREKIMTNLRGNAVLFRGTPQAARPRAISG